MSISRHAFTLPLCLTLGLAACVDTADDGTTAAEQQVPVDDPGGGGGSGGDPAPAVCKHVTVTGKVFYNDLRKFGRFADRKTIFPTIAGSKDAWDTSTDKQNYLGLLDGKVSLFEIDSGWLGNSASCQSTDFQGSTQIDATGAWTWTGDVCDACRDDFDGASDNGVSLAAKIVLQKCDDAGERCFSVDDPQGQGTTNHYTTAGNWGATWSRWYHLASDSAPVAVHQQTTIDLGVDYFQSYYGLLPAVATDQAAQAANLFASMVDVTRRVHVDLGLPFDHGSWGQIRAYFPNVLGGVAHSHQADRLCVSLPVNDWLDGDEAVHEYGHLTHFWQWDGFGKWGSFWFDSDGDGATADDQGESYTAREYPITAFKEGWAQFIRRVTFDGANVGLSCASIESQTPLAPTFTLASGARVCTGVPCVQGRHIVQDVEQALCELWDPTEADTLASNDRLQLSLLDLVSGLQRVWNEADPVTEIPDVVLATSFGPTNTATAPLGLCRLAEKLVANGTSRSLLIETLASDAIDCGL